MLSDFNAASGFILWETIFFLANLIKPLKKKKQTNWYLFLQPGSLLHLYIYFSVLVLY